jgi:hypothetical protein
LLSGLPTLFSAAMIAAAIAPALVPATRLNPVASLVESKDCASQAYPLYSPAFQDEVG